MKKIKLVILTALIPALFLLLSSFPGGGRSSHGAAYSIPEGWEIGSMNLKDGTYQGSSIGFREGLTVEIDIEKGELKEVKVVSHNEIGPQFYQRPINIIPGKIEEKQETKVDSISGATATSMGIMSAVEDALIKARA
jgi:uncharacterized protein with FMN-binding domain